MASSEFQCFCKCLNCLWVGQHSEVDHDRVETCFGPDEIEVCPVCGSLDLINIYPDSGVTSKL